MSEIAFGIVGTNLLNDDVRNSVSFKKDEVLLPGRGFKFFINGKFGGEPIFQRPAFRPVLTKQPRQTVWPFLSARHPPPSRRG
jgi:hypothetical protein